MVIVRFRDKEEHKDMMKKLKKMKEFIEEFEDCLEDKYEDDDEYEFRGGSYRKDMDEEMDMRGGRM